MERILNSPISNSKKPKKRLIKQSTIFIILMLAYPVAHFLLMWIAVNFNSILLCFQVYNGRIGDLQWVTFDNMFQNFENLFSSFNSDFTQRMFLASFAFFIVSCFVTLPIAIFFSYFIFKKIVGNGFFKVIFFLPSILPLIILTLVYKLVLNTNGPLGGLLGGMGIDVASLFVSESTASWMVWIFCVWAGIGYDVILLTAGMARIPRDILESCKMDGVPSLQEFVRIIIPLTWPTITTLFILGMMSMFNVYLQPFFLTSGQYYTRTIGLEIYEVSQGANKATPATLGLFCSLIGAPIILTVRHFLNKMFAEVDY